MCCVDYCLSSASSGRTCLGRRPFLGKRQANAPYYFPCTVWGALKVSVIPQQSTKHVLSNGLPNQWTRWTSHAWTPVSSQDRLGQNLPRPILFVSRAKAREGPCGACSTGRSRGCPNCGPAWNGRTLGLRHTTWTSTSLSLEATKIRRLLALP